MAAARSVLKDWKDLRLAAKHVKANQLKVLYFKKGLLAVHKPYGLPVHNGPGIKICLTDLLPQLQRKLGLDVMPELVNRLDRDCSGIQLLSYKTQTARLMEQLYTRRRITKEYLAITLQVPSAMSGTITIPIGQGTVGEKEKMVLREDLMNTKAHDCPPDVKFPSTSFTVLDSNGDTCALVQFASKTGYKHQVRIHAADVLGCPILGDHKYSESYGPQTLPLRLIQLLMIKGVKSKGDNKGVIRPWQRALVPLHLLASSVTIPELDAKPVRIRTTIPPFFKDTLDMLSLHPKRAKIVEGQLAVSRYREAFVGKPGIGETLSSF